MTNFEPMLAQPLVYEHDKDLQPLFTEQQFQWDAEVKLDGIRALLYMDGENTRLLTRVKGKHTGEYADKINHLPWFIFPQRGTTLDGELTWGANSRECMEVLGCYPSEAIRRQEYSQPVKFTAFDILTDGGEDCRFKTYEQRRALLLDNVYALKRNNSNIDMAERGSARSLWAKGGEGIMLKEPMHQYQTGRRSPSWLKVKRFKKYIAVVTGYSAGKEGKTGKMLGKVGALTLGMWNGRYLVPIGNCGTGFDMDERGIFDWPVHTVVEVASSDVTEDGKLWHPRFLHRRPELNLRDALLEQIQ